MVTQKTLRSITFDFSNTPNEMPSSTTLSPPKTAVNIANIAFTLGMVFSFSISAYAAYRIFSPIDTNFTETIEEIQNVRTFYLISIAAGIISAILFGLGLRLKENVKVNLSLLFIATGVTTYIFETYIEFSAVKQDQSIVGKRDNYLLSDNRTRAEVVSDLRKDGIEAYPNVTPTWGLLDKLTKEGLPTEEGKILPLGGISHRTMVGGNEAGYWMTYVSDRYGFRNPNDVYDATPIDVVIVGDSHTEGWAIRSDETISAVLRMSALNVINLGKSGNGPLLEYATLREYAQNIKPRIVLWQYFLNDHGDLSVELQSKLLGQYLFDDEFSQDLISRQDEIDSALILYIENEIDEKIKQLVGIKQLREEKNRMSDSQEETVHREEFSFKPLIRILKLRNLRRIGNLVPEPITNSELELTTDPTKQIELKPEFKQTLEKANQLVSSWNGRLYFVYLPHTGIARDAEHPLRELVLGVATELDIPIIDIQNEVFASHPDPLSLFPFGDTDLHYNGNGYHFVAESIAERLREDGLLQ
jgi:hypothetical protein